MSIRFTSYILAAALTCGSAAFAGDPMDEALTHRVISGWEQADGTRMAALELALAPGWKTYWRSPGDAGIPPEFSWKGARNLEAVQVHWPSPGIFWEAGMRSVGYKNTVVLPLTIAPKRADKEVRLKGKMRLGVCSDICVPATLQFDAVLPAGSGTRAPAIVAALASLPFTAREAGVSSATCRVSPTEHGVQVEAQITMPSAGGAEAAVIEPSQPGIWVSEPKTARNGGALTVTAEMMHHTEDTFIIDRSALRITVIGGTYSVDIRGCDAG